MTPLHDGTLEAAAKVAEELIDPEWPNDDLSNQAKDIAGRIRALAIKPTPAGEGDTALMSRALERLRLLRDAPSTDPMEKSANGLTYIIEDLEHRLAHAPAASPVQGVDGWQLVPKEPTLEQGEAGIAAMCADEDAHAAEKVRDTYKAMLDATPQSPSTDERVKK